VQSSRHIVTTNKPTPGFLQVICSSCRPINIVRALTVSVSVCVVYVCVKTKLNSNSFFSHDPQRSRARCANYCLLGQLSFLLSVGWEISSEGLLWLTGALIPLLAAIWFQSLKLACATSQTSNCY